MAHNYLYAIHVNPHFIHLTVQYKDHRNFVCGNCLHVIKDVSDLVVLESADDKVLACEFACH